LIAVSFLSFYPSETTFQLIMKNFTGFAYGAENIRRLFGLL
jgi:hypothetical protein